jgi:hypothetical protein
MPVSISSNSDPEFVTTDGAQQDAYTIPIPEGNTCRVELSVFARGYSDGASALWSITGGVKRIGGVLSGIPAGVVNLFTPRKDSGATAWDVTFAIVGDSIVVRVTGSATQTVGWVIDGAIYGFYNYTNGGVV